MKLLYEGSVKKLWEDSNNPDKLYFEFTDDYSIFDWGKMPDQIVNKGLSLTILGAYFFKKLESSAFWKELKKDSCFDSFDKQWLDERFSSKDYLSLEKDGLKHHFKGLTGETGSIELSALEKTTNPGTALYLEVLKAQVFNPKEEKIDGKKIYFYPESYQSTTGKRLIPLEVVFRFGMPQGSSLKKRLKEKPDYYRELGLREEPQEGDLFERPVLEFFTKLEATDRFLSFQEAQEISRLSPLSFNSMVETTFAVALALYNIFNSKGIALFDGKFEFIIVDEDKSKGEPQVLLADSIGPDELRLVYKGHHLSKEFLRQYYKNSDWAHALERSKKEARENPSINFKEYCSSELNQNPEKIKPEDKKTIDLLYPAIVNTLTEEAFFKEAPTLEVLVDSLSKIIEERK